MRDARKNRQKKWPHEILGARSTRKGGLPLKPKCLPFHDWVIFRCMISYLGVLSESLSPVVNGCFEYNHSFIQVVRHNHAVRSISSSRCSISETALERSFEKKRANIRQRRHLITTLLGNFQMQSSAENWHYVFDIGNHPTVVTCLQIAAESFKWKFRFSLSNGQEKGQAQSIHIYGIVLQRCCWPSVISHEITHTLAFNSCHSLLAES